MLGALLGVAIFASAAVCAIAVYRTGDTRPVFRALVTFGVVLVTPILAFWLSAMVLTGSLPLIVAVALVALLGLGLYVVAEGALPSPLRRRQRTT